MLSVALLAEALTGSIAGGLVPAVCDSTVDPTG